MKVDKTKWEKKTFNDVCTIIHGKDHKPVNDVNGKYPIYGSGGIMGTANQYLCESGTTIIGRKGTINSPIFVNQRFWNIDTAFGLHPKEKLVAKFLFYYCKNFDFTTIQSGAAIPSLTRKDILKQTFTLPPLPVQTAIASELDSLQTVIDGYKAQLADLDALAQSVFLEMFGDPVGNPKGWEKTTISKAGTIIGGSTPKTNDPLNWNDGIHNWVTPAELKGERYYGATVKKLTDYALKSSKLTLLPVGTVLLSSRAPIGKVAITTEPMFCNQGFKNIVCGKRLNNEYLYQYLLFNKNELNRRGNGVTFKEISKRIVEDFPLILPPLPLQTQFASRVEAIERQKEQIRQQLKDAETLMAERMQYYFG